MYEEFAEDLLWLIPAFGLVQAVLTFDSLNCFQEDRHSEDVNLDSVVTARSDSKSEDPGDVTRPLISILVPARNEEDNIAGCVSGLTSQTLKNIEIIVLDDCSEDSTIEVARKAAAGDSRFRLIEGEPVPTGWTGKNHACHQLSQAASGRWLMFVDADTHLEPDAAKVALKTAISSQADFLSFWPRQQMNSLGERLMMPLMSFVLLSFLPLRFAEKSGNPVFTAANGQCLLMTSEIYVQCGGHERLGNEIMDDVRLAQMVKASGGKTVVADARDLVRCRMYRSFREIWKGFRKNIYPAFNGRGDLFALSLTVIALGHAVPLVGTIYGIATRQDWITYPLAIQLLISIAIRFMLAIRLNQPLSSSLFHPFATLLLLALSIDSRRSYRGQGVSWKGRLYKREI